MPVSSVNLWSRGLMPCLCVCASAYVRVFVCRGGRETRRALSRLGTVVLIAR